MGKRELVALLYLSSWCFVIVVWLFLAVPWVCLQFLIMVFLDHTHLLYRYQQKLLFKAGFSSHFCKIVIIVSVEQMSIFVLLSQ